MTVKNNVTAKHIHSASISKRMLQGGTIALILIIIFLAMGGEPNPEWPKFWMVRPLIVVSLAGAMGGVFYYLMDNLRVQGRWKKILANLVSLLIYIFALWIGTVLGLDGTMWN